MPKPLREKLEALGFKYVYDTMELDEFGNETHAVKRGEPRSHGRSRNITVVYDQVGCPLIRHKPLDYTEIESLELLVGGDLPHVPHVNDRGIYINSHYPEWGGVIIPGRPRPKPR